MSNYGWYSPSEDRYWETPNNPKAKFKTSWPSDTISVDLKPGETYTYSYDSTTSTLTWTDAGYTTAQLTTYLDSYKISVSESGTSVTTSTETFTVPTDTRAIGYANGAYLTYSLDNTDYMTEWQDTDGTYHDLASAADFLLVIKGIATYVKYCQSAGKTTLAAITAGTVTTYDEVKSTFDDALSTLTSAS